jgi:hypothetical protein
LQRLWAEDHGERAKNVKIYTFSYTLLYLNKRNVNKSIAYEYPGRTLYGCSFYAEKAG